MENKVYLIFVSENPSLRSYLTPDRKYLVQDINDKYCWLYNDANQLRKYKLTYFKTISEYRDITIDQVLDDNEVGE